MALCFPEGSDYPAWVILASYYQPEGRSEVQNFLETLPPILYTRPGQTRVDKYGFGIEIKGDQKFLLQFPGVPAIAIEVDG